MMKFLKKIHPEFWTIVFVSLFFSSLSSFFTYRIVAKQIPKVAVVDLAYLNNEFTMNLARYLMDNKVEDEKIAEVVKGYVSNLELLLKDINESGNYVLLQKQTVVSEGITDITKHLEQVLFESAIQQTDVKLVSGGRDDKIK